MWVCLSLVILLAGCSKDDDGSTGPIAGSDDVIERGWHAFERGEWYQALSEFRTAISIDDNAGDAWNGAGWSAGRIPGMMEDAEVYFAGARQRDIFRYDALGGWVFVAYQLERWEAVIDSAVILLNRRPGWRFLHQSSINFYDVRLLMAATYYNLMDYESSYHIIRDYLNDAFETDPSTPAGQRELLDEIERLRLVYG